MGLSLVGQGPDCFRVGSEESTLTSMWARQLSHIVTAVQGRLVSLSLVLGSVLWSFLRTRMWVCLPKTTLAAVAADLSSRYGGGSQRTFRVSKVGS